MTDIWYEPQTTDKESTVEDKAWDYKELLSKLEDVGTPILKEGAVDVVNAAFDWAQESIDKSENKYDDFALSFLHFARTFVLRLVNKIPGGDSDKAKQALNDAQGQADKLAANPIQALPTA